MRLSLRRIVKCIILLLTGCSIGIFITSDSNSALFTLGFRDPPSRPQNDKIIKTERVLFRSQRSAKSFEIRNTDIAHGQNGLTNVLKRLPATTLNDVFISVKTTGKYHKSRMTVLLDTWISKAKNQTYIFTDEDDNLLTSRLPEGHVINTNCSGDHGRVALTCKMAQEFDLFIAQGKRWFCHVDDDTYVNTDRLLALLRNYNHNVDWYLGKPSLDHQIEVGDRSHPGQSLAWWFATGGAGFCISKALALKMIPHAGGGKLIQVSEQIRLPDDCTIGYIINNVLRKELTVIEEFHSHLEALSRIQTQDVKDQITFGYLLKRGKVNVVDVHGFSEKSDPTRFWSIHCHLNPLTKPCLDHK